MQVTVIALYGPMGAGKSSVATKIAEDNKGTSKIIRFADPLYGLANHAAKWRFGGSDRAAFDLFDLSADILGGKGSAPFVDVSTLVYQDLPRLADEHLSDFAARGIKPRKFLQGAGDLFRDVQKDCFASYLVHNIMTDLSKTYEAWQFDRDQVERKLGVTIDLVDRDTIPEELRIQPFSRTYIVDDLRFPNEFNELVRAASKIRAYLGNDMNVITRMIKLEISREDAAMRVSQRDGVPFGQVMETTSHQSEGGLENYEFDGVVDANQELNDVVADVMSAVTGKPRLIKGENVIDLGMLRKK